MISLIQCFISCKRYCLVTFFQLNSKTFKAYISPYVSWTCLSLLLGILARFCFWIHHIKFYTPCRTPTLKKKNFFLKSLGGKTVLWLLCLCLSPLCGVLKARSHTKVLQREGARVSQSCCPVIQDRQHQEQGTLLFTASFHLSSWLLSFFFLDKSIVCPHYEVLIHFCFKHAENLLPFTYNTGRTMD